MPVVKSYSIAPLSTTNPPLIDVVANPPLVDIENIGEPDAVPVTKLEDVAMVQAYEVEFGIVVVEDEAKIKLMPPRRMDSFVIPLLPAIEKRAPGVDVPMPTLPKAEFAVLRVNKGVFAVDVAKLKTLARPFGIVEVDPRV